MHYYLLLSRHASYHEKKLLITDRDVIISQSAAYHCHQITNSRGKDVQSELKAWNFDNNYETVHNKQYPTCNEIGKYVQTGMYL